MGLLGAAEFVPTITMAFVGGALADYVDRRRMVLTTELVMALSSALLIANSLLPHPQAWVLFLCATAFAGTNGLQRPSLEALTPKLVPPELIPSVAALRAVGSTLGGVLAPALGGVLATTVGPARAYSITFCTFAFSLMTLSMMRATPPPLNADRPSLRSLAEGLRYARSRPELMGTYLIDINAMFFGMPMALFPAIATRFGGAAVGLLYAAPSAGAFVASLASGWSGFPVPSKAIAKGATEDWIIALALYICTVAGMLCRYIYRYLEKPKKRRDEWDWGLFLRPIFASPLVFLPLFAAFQGTGIEFKTASALRFMIFFVAFQNGFLWTKFVPKGDNTKS